MYVNCLCSIVCDINDKTNKHISNPFVTTELTH